MPCPPEILNVREGDEVLFLYRDGRITIERLPGTVEPGAAYGILYRPGQEPVDLEAARKRYRAERGTVIGRNRREVNQPVSPPCLCRFEARLAPGELAVYAERARA